MNFPVSLIDYNFVMNEFDLFLIKMDKSRVIYAYLILDGFFSN